MHAAIKTWVLAAQQQVLSAEGVAGTAYEM
jgi:hypothetical protein